MRQNISVTLPEKLKAELEEMARDDGLSRSEIVRSALQDYVLIRKFRALRNKMMARAQAQGVFSDEDVFESVS